MRKTLQDIIRQCGNLVTVLKVTGTDTETRVDATADDKTMFIKVAIKEPISDFEGLFGVPNLGLLNGLLGFAAYGAEDSSFSLKRRNHNGVNMVEQFEFKDGKKRGAVFRLMPPSLIPDQAEMRGKINWEVVFTPDKGKTTEFATLAGLYSEVEKSFTPRTEGGNLIFAVGNENGSTHHASMVIHEDIGTELKGNLRYSTAQYLAILKLAGQNPVDVSITSRGLLKIGIETQYALYDYYLRSVRD